MLFHAHLGPLVDPRLALGLAVGYVVCGVAGNRFMEDKKPLALTNLKLVYNLSQIVVCGITAVKLAPFFMSADTLYGLKIAPNAQVEWWVFVYYLCKLLDFFDTFFIVVGRKTRQFTLLHVWHHASIVPLFAYYLSAGLGAGTLSWLPLLNSVIHVLMYSHYLITSLVNLKNMWWKPWLTSAQIAHHFALIVIMTSAWCMGNPEVTLTVAFSGISWGISILGLFVKFHIDSYRPKSKAQ